MSSDSTSAQSDPRPASNDEVVSSIDIDRSIDDVWWAIVEPSKLSRWMGPGSRIQPWPGGELRVPDIATGIPRRGRISSVEPRRRIEFVWWPEPSDRDDDSADGDDYDAAAIGGHVVFELTPRPGGTRFTVIETAPGAGPRLSALASAGMWRVSMLSVALGRSRVAPRS